MGKAMAGPPVDLSDPEVAKKVVRNIEEYSEEEKNSLTALEQMLGEDDVGRYKIEVMFSTDRTTKGASFKGAIVFWISGSELSGGGDTILYPCLGENCKGLIGPTDLASVSHSAFCKECGQVWNQDDLEGITVYRLTDKNWAELIAKSFVRANCNSDIYLKHARGEMKEAVNYIKGKEGGYVGDKLRETRKQTSAMYRFRDIIKDCNNGSTIEAKVLSFLRA